MRAVALASVLATGLVLCESPLSAESPHSFSTAVLFPLTQGMVPYAVPPRQELAAGERLVSWSAVWTNSLRYDGGWSWPGFALIVDGETLVGKREFRLGLGAGASLEAWIEGSSLFAGVMDPFLSDFHHFFGLPNQWRDEVPPNRLSVRVAVPGGMLEAIADPRNAVDSAGLGFEWRPLPEPFPALTLRVKPPLSAPAPWLLSDAWGASLSAGESFARGPFDGGLAVGIAWQDRPDIPAGLETRSWLPQAGARLFYSPLRGLAVGVEAAAMASPFAVAEMYLGGVVGNLWIGANFDLSPGLRLETAVIEELASWASIEVGFQFGVSLFDVPRRSG